MKNLNSSFVVRAETIGQLIQADNMAALQKRLGLNALLDLAQDAVTVKIGHGAAVSLAAVLKDGGLGAARAKYYSEKACQIAAAIQHRAMLASSKVRGEAAKAETRAASMLADFAELAGMSSVAAAQTWAKKNGPKAKAETADTETAETAETADNNAPSPQAIETAGQLREIKEIMAMVAAGTVEHDEALLKIAEIIGMAAKVNVGVTLAQAKAKAAKVAPLAAVV